MSTSYGQQVLRLPKARRASLMLGGIGATLIAGASAMALLGSQGASTIRPQPLPAPAYERPAGRGEMEFPGIEALPAALAPRPGTTPLHSGHGGLMELPGLEATQTASAPLGEPRGGLQEYAQTL